MSKKLWIAFGLVLCMVLIGSPAAAVVELNIATTYSGANMHAETCREFA